ncbi:MAG: rubredoxin [Cytophagaceae bacterium]|jgi:rubredoxin|nr:rubredoxin [Cytophagaceae bacterium]
MSTNIPITVFTNGGIVSPGDLRKIAMAAHQSGAEDIYIGNRQELRFYTSKAAVDALSDRLSSLNVRYAIGETVFKNIVTSAVIKDILKTKIWLTEGYYRDLLESFTFQPAIPINIVDSDQYAVPLFSGTLNFIAAAEEDFWYIFIHAPNHKISDWMPVLINTAQIPFLVERLEPFLMKSSSILTMEMLMSEVYKSDFWVFKNYEKLPRIPAYHYFRQEGFHSMGEKFWLGVFNKKNRFSITSLDAFAVAALETKIGSFYITPWDSIMVKNISEEHISVWEDVLGLNNINTGHAAVDLCWNCNEWDLGALGLRNKISQILLEQDARCEGMIIGVNTPIHDSFYSINIQEEGLFSLFGKKYFSRYHIRYKESFNPNDPTVKPFMDHIPEKELPSFIHYLMDSFYKNKREKKNIAITSNAPKGMIPKSKYIYLECKHCATVYHPQVGDSRSEIPAGVSFDQLPDAYVCSVCSAPKTDFILSSQQIEVLS